MKKILFTFIALLICFSLAVPSALAEEKLAYKWSFTSTKTDVKQMVSTKTGEIILLTIDRTEWFYRLTKVSASGKTVFSIIPFDYLDDHYASTLAVLPDGSILLSNNYGKAFIYSANGKLIKTMNFPKDTTITVTNNRIWTYVANKVTAFDPKFTKIFETSVSTNKYLYATFLPAPSGNKWALYARLKSNSYTAIALYDKTKFIKLFDYHATYSVSGFQFNRDGSRMYVAIKKPFVGSDSRLYSYNTSDGSTRFQYTAPKLSADENLRGDSDIRMIQGFSFVDISNNNDLAVNAYDTMMTLVFDDNGKIKLKINRDKFGQNSGAADGLIYSHLSVYDKRGTLVDTLPEYKPTRTPNLQGYFYGAAHDVFVLHDSNIYRYVPQHADILNHWAYDSMMMLEKNSVMEAARPNEIVTSSQFINIASRLDLSRPIDTSFLNAADKTITKRMIASTLGEYAYILGDNNYDKALTRAEVAVITVRYINALK